MTAAPVPTIRLLLSGGPKGGKSTIVRLLRQHLAAQGVEVLEVPESATATTEMLSPEARALLTRADAVLQFQIGLGRLQVERERLAERMAEMVHRLTGRPVVLVFDRGVFDGVAFTGDAEAWDTVVKEVEAGMQTKLDRVTFREQGMPAFDAVVHLQTCALGNDAEAYTAGADAHRIHDSVQAAFADILLEQVYRSHPEFTLVFASDVFADKVDRVLGVVDQMLAAG